MKFRGQGEWQSCNSLEWGLGTYTHGWEILSSYVYYYFFFFPAILQEAEVWHWIEWDERVGGLARSPSLDTGLWLVKERLVPPLSRVYSFASRKRVSCGNNFTSNSDLLGSSWVTWKNKTKQNTYSKGWNQYSFLHMALSLPMHINFEPYYVLAWCFIWFSK